MKNKFLPLLYGVVKDIHPRGIPENKVADCENVIFKQGKIMSRYGFKKLGPETLNGAISGIAYYEQVRLGDKFVLVFTSRDAYLYDSTTGSFTPVTLQYNTGTAKVNVLAVTGVGTTWLDASWTLLDTYQIKFGASSPGTNSILFTGDTSAGWIERTGSGSRDFNSIASSSDGTKLVACVSVGYIYTSDDSGVSWTERDSSRAWKCLASSSDGSALAVCVWAGYIYTSGDSGVNWSVRTASGQRLWNGLASSSDGTKLAACVQYGYIYTSDDSGVSWTERTGPGALLWYDIASSSDGTKLVACEFDANGRIFRSDDSGATWSELTGAGTGPWKCISCSADGTKIIAFLFNGYLKVSDDSGATWQTKTGAGAKYWGKSACSNDGISICVSTLNEYIYISVDFGETWQSQAALGSKSWSGIASSSDGSALATCVSGGYVYTFGETYDISSISSLANLYVGLELSASFLQAGTRIVAINFGTSVITVDKPPVEIVTTGSITADISTWYDVHSVDSATGITLNAVETFVGDVTDTSPVVDGIADTSILHVGMGISGTGIPANTYILSIDSSTQITMSENATATNSDVTISCGLVILATHEVDYVLRLCFNGDPDDFWSFAYPYDDVLGDKILVATNGVDPILKWDGTGSMEYLAGGAGMPETAKYIGYFGAAMFEHFVAAWTTDSGNSMPQTVEVSDAGDAEVWSGIYYDFIQQNDEIVGIEILKDRLAIYKKKSICLLYPDASGGATDPFSPAQDVIIDIEIPVGRTVVNFGDYHIFLGLANVYKFNGVGIEEIGSEVINTMKNEWNGQYMHHAFAFAIPTENLYCLFIPTLAIYDADGNVTKAEAQYPDKAYVYNYQERTWTIWTFDRQFTCAAFVNKLYAPTVADIDALDQTWAQMTMRWVDLIAYSNIQSLLIGDVDGNIYEMRDVYDDDDGVDIFASVTLRDYNLNDPQHVFMLNRLIISLARKGELDTIKVRVSVDFGRSWSAWSILSEYGANDYLEKIAHFRRKGLQVRVQIDNISGAPFEIESVAVGFNDGLPDQIYGVGVKPSGD